MSMKVGDKVILKMLLSNEEIGTIQELWANSVEAKMSGHYRLDKYKVKLQNNNNVLWVYGSDLKKV